jgi:hypothetical protein
MDRLCQKLITCQNREISIDVASSRVMLFNDVIAAEILWTRRKLNTLEMVADRSPAAQHTKLLLVNRAASQHQEG